MPTAWFSMIQGDAAHQGVSQLVLLFSSPAHGHVVHGFWLGCLCSSEETRHSVCYSLDRVIPVCLSQVMRSGCKGERSDTNWVEFSSQNIVLAVSHTLPHLILTAIQEKGSIKAIYSFINELTLKAQFVPGLCQVAKGWECKVKSEREFLPELVGLSG